MANIEYGIPIPPLHASPNAEAWAAIRELAKAERGASVLLVKPDGVMEKQFIASTNSACNQLLGKGNYARRRVEGDCFRVWKL